VLDVLQVLAAVRKTVWVVDDHGATDQPLPAGSCFVLLRWTCCRCWLLCVERLKHLALATLLCAAVLDVLQVLAAVRETVWVVDDHGATDQPLPAGCGGVAAMAVSPNGAFVALACNDGRLRVMTSGELSTAVEYHQSPLERTQAGTNSSELRVPALHWCQTRSQNGLCTTQPLIVNSWHSICGVGLQ
jgi:hypothetical protein